MDRITKVFLGMVALAALAIVAFFTIGPPAEKVWVSPQEAFKGAQKAAAKNDMAEWCQTITDGSRDLLAAKAVIHMVLTKVNLERRAKEEAKDISKEFDQVLSRHGVSLETVLKLQDQLGALVAEDAMTSEVMESVRALAPQIRNPNGLLVSAHKTLQKYTGRSPLDLFFWDLLKSPMSRGQAPPADFWQSVMSEGRLDDVNISNDVAQGKLVDNRLKGLPIVFRKQGEGWRIDLVAMEQQAQPQMPPGMPPGMRGHR